MLINLRLTLVRGIKWLPLCSNCTWSLTNNIEKKILIVLSLNSLVYQTLIKYRGVVNINACVDGMAKVPEDF
jgi:hypothetical protein